MINSPFGTPRVATLPQHASQMPAEAASLRAAQPPRDVESLRTRTSPANSSNHQPPRGAGPLPSPADRNQRHTPGLGTSPPAHPPHDILHLEEGRPEGSSANGSKPAALATGGEQPGSHRFMDAAKRTAMAVVRMSDLRTALMRGDDDLFIAGLRAPQPTPAGTQSHDARLLRLNADVAHMREVLLQSQAPAALIVHLNRGLAEIESTLQALQTDRPLGTRMAVHLAMHGLLSPLPLAVPVYNRQNQFASELVGLYAKTTLMAIGSMRSPTATNKHSLLDHFMARHYINIVQAAIFVVPTFVGKLNKAGEHPGFTAAAGALSTAALFGGFFGKEIKELLNTWRHGSPNPDLTAAAAVLTSTTRDALASVMNLVQADQAALLGARDEFTQNGQHELSPYTSKQVTLAANAYTSIASELGQALGLQDTTPAENRDRTAKLALAVFASAVCATTTGLMYPDKIGMVDLGADAIFTTALMVKLAVNHNVTQGDALEEFKSFAGLSLVMLTVLTANQAADQFIDRGPTGLLVGSVAMAALNCTLPGPLGHAAGLGIEKLMNMSPGKLMESIKSVGHGALQYFKGLVHMPAVPSTVTLTEMDAAQQT
jgi:hypothetical protein